MNLDDMMKVWQSQDSVTLHGVNETQLRLVLRHDHERLQVVRRKLAWGVHLTTGVIVFILAILFVMMMFPNKAILSGSDFAIPIVGVAAVVSMCVALYVNSRTQDLREQRFGESLRDQIARRIAQLDYAATTTVWRLSLVLIIGLVGAIAIKIAAIAVNSAPNQPFEIDWTPTFMRMLAYVFVTLICIFIARREMKQRVLPLKQRLKALLREIDSQ